ncbi:MAG: ribbon-helix-helix domain-containing protein [Porticoccaceae bacterium]|nr:ribbon-helix-helix domain-containing protein [Porticoccaceae bacterium]
MCKLFIDANTKLWETSARSIRIQGMVTSIKLEFHFWRVLEEIAERDSLTIPEMINRLYSESIDAGHDLSNFTSFLRVCAIRFIGLQLAGDIPVEKDISIASLDADAILQSEATRNRPLFQTMQ